MKSKQNSFNLYRYQIVPIESEIPHQLFELHSYKSIEELKFNKNNIFKEVFSMIIEKRIYKETEILLKKIIIENDMFLLKIAAKRNMKRYNSNLDEENIESYPNIYVAFNNNPAIQELYIQNNYSAFNSVDTVKNLLDDLLNSFLKNFNLALYIIPEFEEKCFWEIVKKHEKNITKLRFELIKPNMSNISKSLKEDLKELQSNTNSHNTIIELNSSKGKSLDNISQENLIVESLVDYSSKGGGEILIRAKGVKKSFKIGKFIQITKSIEQLDLITRNPKKIINYLFGNVNDELF